MGALKREGGRVRPGGILEEMALREGRTGEGAGKGQGGTGPFAARSLRLRGAGGMKDGGLGKCVCQQWAGHANARSCQAGRRFQGRRRKDQRTGSSDKSLAGPATTPSTPPSPATSWGGAGVWGGVPPSFFIIPLPSPSPQERPSSGPQGSCHPMERGLCATVHFGESLAEIIS